MTNGRARTVLAGLLSGLLIVTGGAVSVTRTAAQGGDQCVALAEQAIAEAGTYCGELLPGEVCYGHGAISARPLGASELSAVSAGDRAPLDALDALATAAADPAGEGWGVAVLSLPAAEGATITGVLFGDAQIARPPVAGAERPTLPVFNRGSAQINLRDGAGITYAVVGQLAAGEEALADGRNEQGDWLRVQFAGGIAWAFTPLIGWEGDQSAINALAVLLPNDVTPVKVAGVPFESFTLTSGGAPCAAMAAGLLLQFAGEGRAEITANQVTLAFADATLLVTAAPGDSLTVRALAGAGTVTARGVSVEVAAGEEARVNLGGDGLTPVAAPVALRAFPFTDVAYAPLDLLAEPVACLVGAPGPDAQVSLRVGPGAQRGTLGSLSTATTYTAIGWANDPDGAPWWQLDTGAQPSWAAQAEVRAVGACQAVAQVEPPPLVFAPPSAPPAGGEAAPAGVADLAPTANSVWQMRPGSDNMTGECSGAPAINFCDHLAAIAPAAGGLSWKGMEASAYFLSRIQPNVYAYAGPNVLGTGRVSMTLSFTSETTLTMTMSLVLNSEPSCQHIYYYTGTRNW